MRIGLALLAIALLAVGTASPAAAGRLHNHRVSNHHGGVRGGDRVAARRYPPLAGTVGTPIPRSAARFMGYPYNVPGYRYEYADTCLLRVGGIEGPGPSIGRCPFGADRADD